VRGITEKMCRSASHPMRERSLASGNDIQVAERWNWPNSVQETRPNATATATASAAPQPPWGTTIPKCETHLPVEVQTGIGSGPSGVDTHENGSACRGHSRAKVTSETDPLITNLPASRSPTCPVHTSNPDSRRAKPPEGYVPISLGPDQGDSFP